MRDDSIERAINEAMRFLSRAGAYQQRRETDSLMEICGAREGGDLRRSSMDLTRALADMRQGR